MNPLTLIYNTGNTNEIVFFSDDNTFIADAKDIGWGEETVTFPPTVFIIVDGTRKKFDFVKAVKGKDGNIRYCEYKNINYSLIVFNNGAQ